MAEWVSGRESKYLDAIIDGKKAYEGRLNRGKFAQYNIGDRVVLRRDERLADGTLIEGDPEVAVVITGIEKFKSFNDMLHILDYKTVIPDAVDVDDAIRRYASFYSQEDEAKYGVLAIKVELSEAGNL